MTGPPSDVGAGPSQQRLEQVEYMLITMKGYIDTGVVDLRSEMTTRFGAMQISIDEIRRATVLSTPTIDP